jgi:hypothetical protein
LAICSDVFEAFTIITWAPVTAIPFEDETLPEMLAFCPGVWAKETAVVLTIASTINTAIIRWIVSGFIGIKYIKGSVIY